MSVYDNLGRKKEQKLDFEDIEFYASCHRCNEEVETAQYARDAKIIVYTCSQGHRSTIEGIDFF